MEYFNTLVVTWMIERNILLDLNLSSDLFLDCALAIIDGHYVQG